MPVALYKHVCSGMGYILTVQIHQLFEYLSLMLRYKSKDATALVLLLL